MVSELVLALSDPLLRALTDGLHDVWVALAELPLLVYQAWDVVADHTGPERTDVPEDAKKNKKNKKFQGGFKRTRHTDLCHLEGFICGIWSTCVIDGCIALYLYT